MSRCHNFLSGAPEPKAFRTNPIVLAEPKSVYGPEDTGNKYLQPSGFLDQNNMVILTPGNLSFFCIYFLLQPYRSSSFGIATPKPVTDAKIGFRQGDLIWHSCYHFTSGLGYWEIQSFKHAPQMAAGKAK